MARSLGSNPSRRAVIWLLIPRQRSPCWPSAIALTFMLSFLLIERPVRRLRNLISTSAYNKNEPRWGSITTSDSFPLPFPSTSSVKNCFKPFPSFPFCMAVMSSTAVAVDVKRCRAFNFSLHKMNQSLPFSRCEYAQSTGLLWTFKLLPKIGTLNFGRVGNLKQAVSHRGLV